MGQAGSNTVVTSVLTAVYTQATVHVIITMSSIADLLRWKDEEGEGTIIETRQITKKLWLLSGLMLAAESAPQKSRKTLSFKFRCMVLVVVVLGVCGRGSWATPTRPHYVVNSAKGRCTPCNSTVQVDTADLPVVGFICSEGFPESITHQPYTCLVFFRQSHNLTLYLHNLYPGSLSVSTSS